MGGSRPPVVGRLAPTPSGELHLGNALAFGAAWLSVRRQGGRVLLRMEDIDRQRSVPAIADAIRRDLEWLGLTWDEEVPAQSVRPYARFLELLGPFTYRCTCTRAQIRRAGGVYPGWCRDAGRTDGAVRFRLPPGEVGFLDRARGPQRVDPAVMGDTVLVRRDGVVAYGLAVVVDDLLDGVTEVVRGEDLLAQTGPQIRLWEALGATPPTWAHSPVLYGHDGKKLSKSHQAMGVAALRDAGWQPGDVWRVLLPWLGVTGAATLDEAMPRFQPTNMPPGPITLGQELHRPV